MECLFKVEGKDRFNNSTHSIVSVFGIRTAKNSNKAEFLIYTNNIWCWVNADLYMPMK